MAAAVAEPVVDEVESDDEPSLMEAVEAAGQQLDAPEPPAGQQLDAPEPPATQQLDAPEAPAQQQESVEDVAPPAPSALPGTAELYVPSILQTCGLWGCTLSRTHTGLCSVSVSETSRQRKRPRAYEAGPSVRLPSQPKPPKSARVPPAKVSARLLLQKIK